jgi:hypothetical protein
LKTILQKGMALGASTFLLFIDIKKAYDSVDRAKLWTLLAAKLPEAADITSCIK